MSDRPKRALEVLDVREPCPENWSEMRGDDKVRFCRVCAKNVFDLSRMTHDEASSLLEGSPERLCVRFYRRADGTVATIDCAPVRFAAMRRLARRTLSGAAAMLVALLGLVGSLSLFRLLGLDVSTWLADSVVARIAKAVEPELEPEIMGEVSVEPPPEGTGIVRPHHVQGGI